MRRVRYHARDDTSDVDETPVKKGKSKSKAENVPAADAEEPTRDDDWYGPEGQALGEDDEEGAAQRADEDETALVAPRGPRVEKKAGSRTTGRQRIFLDRSVESFTAVRIGGVRELPALSPADRMRCRVEWQQRIRYIILQRWTLVRSDEAMDGTFRCHTP